MVEKSAANYTEHNAITADRLDRTLSFTKNKKQGERL